ncbi:alginate export family protein [Acinetobacter tandoii]|jgi:hypothetical protein|uniref:alginate export family protein n=1 Tax=Acinetobacter tandoii TaxID=202954 RepID=UPI0040464C27
MLFKSALNKKSFLIRGLIVALTTSFLVPSIGQAENILLETTNGRIDELRIEILNPTTDQAYNQKIIDQVRRTLAMYPGDHATEEKIDFNLIQVKKNPALATTSYTVESGVYGGVNIVIRLQLKSDAEQNLEQGILLNKERKVFPVLYDANGRFLKAKFELLGMYYANQNAWYGNPDAMLQSNPLIDGKSSGAGYADWVESFIYGGLYGMYPISDNTYSYAGLSAIGSFSTGQELFTDKTRSHLGVEDAFVGVVTGKTTEAGNRTVLNLSAGRERFSLGDGMLIVNTASNGGERAALQSNARWSADFVGKAQLQYNRHRLEIFQVDPDELPVLDTKTIINGINAQTNFQNTDLGLSYLTVPKSNASYYMPEGQKYTREGLKVWDVRAHWNNTVANRGGIFLAGEYAQQTHDDFNMKAEAYSVEAGYSWPTVKYAPTFSYRYAKFTGDDPKTDRYERWDPLLSGGNGEQWVQGINHFKVVQDSNLISHRFQARFRPHQKIELVPQYWIFKADSELNLGGNPALSFLDSKDYGQELNLTFKYFYSRNIYVHGHIAYTKPGEAVKQALNGQDKDWWSTMMFVRYAF